MKIKPKNWESFQHYRDGSKITWIKLYTKLLDDFEFHGLPLASRALAPQLWLLAATVPDAIIDATPERLAFRLRWPVQEVTDGLSPLIGKGFFDVVQFEKPGPSASLDDAYTASSTDIKQEGYTPRGIKNTVPLTRDGAQRMRKAQIKTEALEYLAFLNSKAGKHFRPVEQNLKFIEARLAEGVSLQDLKTLTIRKCREWLGTDQAKYLRPETLCNATKCHSYLGEIEPEAPGGEPCNARPAIEASSRTPSRADADGPRPTSHESPPTLQ